MVNRANNRVFAWKPITPEEIKPQGVDPWFREDPYWTTAMSMRLLEGVRALRFGEKGRQQLSDADKQTLEWKDNFIKVMNSLSDWKASDEPSEEDYLHEKTEILTGLLELAPTESPQSDVLDKLLRFLGDFSLDRVGRVEWFWDMQMILYSVDASDKNLKAIALNKMSSSKIPLLALYATLMSEGL
jgi:hypothetical protein